MMWRSRTGRPRPNLPRSPRLSGRRIGSSASRLGKTLLWIAVVGGVIWGSLWSYGRLSPHLAKWFEIHEVAVSGLGHVTRTEVLERLALPQGQSVLWVRPRHLAERLQGHPWIKTAEITRQPPHRLTVTIIERSPAAVLRTTAAAVLLDDEGHALANLKPDEDPDLPVLIGLDPKAVIGGDVRSRLVAQAGIKVAILLERSFEGRPEVDVRDPDNAVGYVQGLRFQFGPSSFDEKWDRYRKIQPHASSGSEGQGGHWNEVDLRYPGKVIFRERG